MKCIRPQKHKPQFESKHNCKSCNGDRLRLMETADKLAKERGYKSSPTGMYFCVEETNLTPPYFVGEIPPSGMNICSICIFIEDCPTNYGNIRTTPYDGDCDECGLDSRFYVGV